MAPGGSVTWFAFAPKVWHDYRGHALEMKDKGSGLSFGPWGGGHLASMTSGVLECGKNSWLRAAQRPLVLASLAFGKGVRAMPSKRRFLGELIPSGDRLIPRAPRRRFLSGESCLPQALAGGTADHLACGGARAGGSRETRGAWVVAGVGV